MTPKDKQKSETRDLSDDSYFDDSDDFSADEEQQIAAQAMYAAMPQTAKAEASGGSHAQDMLDTPMQHDSREDADSDEENVDPTQIIESIMPPGHSIENPPPSISAISTLSSAPRVMAHLNAIQNVSLTHVNAITKDDPEYGLLLSSVTLIIAIENEKNRIFCTLLEVYGAMFPELADIVHQKDEYAHVANICGTTFVRDPASEGDHEAQNDIITKLYEILPSQQVAVIVALASVAKGVGDRAEAVLRNTDAFIASAHEEMKLLEEIKQIFLDHLSQRIHLHLPNLSNLVGPSIAAQLFGIVSGNVERIMMMTREEVMQLGAPYQDRKQSSEDLIGIPAGYVVNCDLVLFVKNNPVLDAYTVQKVVKAVANKVVLAVRVDVGRYAPDGEKGFFMKKAVIRRINRLEKDIADKERKRMQNFENRQRLMDDIRAHKEEMRLNRQVYGKESTADTERAFELWKNARLQEAAQNTATLYSHNRGRMTAKQHGRHQQMVASTTAAREAGMTVPEYEEHQRELERIERDGQKRGFRRLPGNTGPRKR